MRRHDLDTEISSVAVQKRWGKLLLCGVSRERKQQRRQQLRKRHLKSEFALLQSLSRFFHLVQFVKCW